MEPLENRPYLRPLLFFILVFSIALFPGCGSDEAEEEEESTIFTALASWGLKSAVDSSGDIYITGMAFGNLSSGSGSGEADLFLRKVNPDGTKQWLKQVDSSDSGTDFVQDITINRATDSIYLAGYTSGSMPGNTSSGAYDLFVMKYDVSGDRKWIRQLGSSFDDFCWGITADASDNIYITGSTYGSMPGSGKTNAEGVDLFLMKLDSSGSTVWSRQLGTDNRVSTYTYSQSFGTALDVDASGDILLVGFSNDSIFGSNSGGNDILLAKYDAAGNQVWSRQFGTFYSDYARDVVTSAGGEIYFTGYSYGTLDPSHDFSGTNDYSEVLTGKYDGNGNSLWFRQAGTSVGDWGYGIALDASEDVFVTGNTNGDVTGDNAGEMDFFLIRYTSGGVHQATIQNGSSVNDSANGVVIDGSNRIYLTGRTYGTLNGKANSSAAFATFIARYANLSLAVDWTAVY